MRRRFLLPVIALALPLLFAPTVAAGGVQVPDEIGQTVGWNALWVPTNVAAETFTTPNKVERLDSVSVFFHAIGSGATVEAWIHAGAPSMTAIAGTDVTTGVNVGTGQNAWTSLVSPTSIVLSANTQYSVMFRVVDGTNTTSFAGEIDATSYAGGAAYYYNGTTWATPVPNNVQDLSFEVFMSPLPGTMDQQQNVHSSSVGFAVSGQTFVAGVTGSLNAVSLWSNGSDGSAAVTVEICTGTTGIDCAGVTPVILPAVVNAGILGSSALTVPGSAVQWFNFVFSSPIPITAGTHYAIVVLGDAAWAGSSANSYGNGAAYDYEGSWSALGGEPVSDLAFQTFITPGSGSTLPPTSSAAAAPGNPGGSVPMPLLLALMATLPAMAAILAKRSVVRATR